ncbi:muscarinic acetylcholine receptor DM1-like [Schistocerca cancellata]|uniref:muscarinic acetylcholine receptor DM1-like n=1 Tax=Schistocerca cancellata TaxID=274614 RepID=UPI002117F20D|nr:muscarinic acetylcholine receptor DM1-like [Schistocerca cancellata]
MVLIAIVAGFLSLVTVVGNSMVMISFKIDKQLQTISNYFLFSLAVADLAIGLISMPLFTVSTILGYWPLGPHICDTWLALDYLASNASVLNLLIISFDRYFSVTRPLTYRAKRTTNRAAIMIAALARVDAALHEGHRAAAAGRHRCETRACAPPRRCRCRCRCLPTSSPRSAGPTHSYIIALVSDARSSFSWRTCDQLHVDSPSVSQYDEDE